MFEHSFKLALGFIRTRNINQIILNGDIKRSDKLWKENEFHYINRFKRFMIE